MRVEQVLAELERCGTEQNRRLYPRHGVTPPLFGVGFSHLSRLARKVGVDQALANDLWAAGVHDARMLATRVADPRVLTPRGTAGWLGACSNHFLTEAFAGLVAHSPLAESRAEMWRDRRAEWPAAAGWVVTAHLVVAGHVGPETGWALLDQITREIHGRPNRVRHEMNSVVIAVGITLDALADEALAAADAIGEVRVDHGRTNCRTPAARDYIERARRRVAPG